VVPLVELVGCWFFWFHDGSHESVVVNIRCWHTWVATMSVFLQYLNLARFLHMHTQWIKQAPSTFATLTQGQLLN